MMPGLSSGDGAFSVLTAGAVVPEQLPCYVRAVSGSEAWSCPGVDSFVQYRVDESVVLVAYPSFSLSSPAAGQTVQTTGRGEEPIWPAPPPLLEEQLRTVLTALPPRTRQLTVLSPWFLSSLPLPSEWRAVPVAGGVRPSDRPQDWYWTLPLPCAPPSDKVRNMLRRADREVIIRQEAWGPEAASLVASYCRTRRLEEGTRHIFGQLQTYLANCPGARLFTARRRMDGSLAACAVGDFTAMGTAFYQFAFRRPDAPPGTADALLAALLEEAARQGHSVMNLGLGIGPGIRFFKQKWRARRALPYGEFRWKIMPAHGGGTGRKPGLLARLFGA